MNYWINNNLKQIKMKSILLGFSIFFGILGIYSYLCILCKKPTELENQNFTWNTALICTLLFIIVYCIRDYLLTN